MCRKRLHAYFHVYALMVNVNFLQTSKRNTMAENFKNVACNFQHLLKEFGR